MTAVVIIEAVVIVLLLILVAGLLKSHAEILRRLDRLGATDDGDNPTTSPHARTTGLGQAPSREIVGVDPQGSTVSVSLEHGDGETLLAFMSSGCASCHVFWEELSAEPRMPTAATRPIIVTKGPTSESPARVAELAPGHIRVVMSDDAWDEFKVPLTPYFMLIDRHGNVIGEGSAANMDRLLGLFQQSAADSSPIRMDTRRRGRFTDNRLSRSGVEPGDPSLYEDPVQK
ncbi:MAG TPA: hypothetical protein VMP13_07820 [Acidimicrobiia bacterium]|nr:hypothetical protein [Acidimicrobiia bacterium]